MTRSRVENKEGSLGYPGFVKSVFTKDSKLLGKRRKITRAPWDCDTRTHLKKVSLLRGPSLVGDLNTGVSLETDHLIGTSAYAP
ncbi:hypothetical protein TNCV_2680571 [Trichonephila clavipes]|uniref:Uncharacterized protein n=1 Tax=Trichonephila clavipes TaxID=2585209 RepID=A0A8X6S7S9_TRICX|nr:hypothetical protein TNCV_2680571 [Trichonephila clavipes]